MVFHWKEDPLTRSEALDLSRLQILVLDMHLNIKRYSLLTLPQVRFGHWFYLYMYMFRLYLEADDDRTECYMCMTGMNSWRFSRTTLMKR